MMVCPGVTKEWKGMIEEWVEVAQSPLEVEPTAVPQEKNA